VISTPLPVATGDTTICAAFQATAAAFADRPAIHSMDGRIDWTWSEYARQVRETAAGLRGLGLLAGDTMGCWMSNRPELHVADTAAMHLGAVSFSIDPGYSAEQAEHLLRDADTRVLVTEESAAEPAAAIRAGGRTSLETIIVVDDGSSATTMSWHELLECASEDFDLERSLATVKPDDVAALTYTSGTRGPANGVELTHRNAIAQTAAMSARLRLPPGISAVSCLPMAHIAERLATHYLPMLHGWRVTTCAQPHAIATAIADTQPQFLLSLPGLWEELRAVVLAGTGGRHPSGASAIHALERVGLDRLAVALICAAPVPDGVIEFWQTLGVRLGELDDHGHLRMALDAGT
jgi:long-chain acyl-CoA synthetase